MQSVIDRQYLAFACYYHNQSHSHVRQARDMGLATLSRFARQTTDNTVHKTSHTSREQSGTHIIGNQVSSLHDLQHQRKNIHLQKLQMQSVYFTSMQ
jgi:hypothetical protein